MRILVVAGALIALMFSSSAHSEVRITYDEGGSITAYVARYNFIRDSGESVVIDGVCLSACTLVVGIVPPERVCVTRNAFLGFHAARRSFQGIQFVSDSATTDLMSHYPPKLRSWLNRRGGLGEDLVFLDERSMSSMIKRCR